VAFKGKTIEGFAGETVFVGDHLGAGELAEVAHVEAVLDMFAEGACADAEFGGDREGRAHGHPGHTFYAGSYYNVLGAAHDGLGGELDGLLG
jgi:hypothetical protein